MQVKIWYNITMETRMNTKKNELNIEAILEDLSKAEIITLYRNQTLELEELRETVDQLINFLQLGKAQKFGASSERFQQEAAGQLSLFDELDQGVFNEAEAIEVETEENAKPQKGHARRLKGEVGASKHSFDHLPVVEVIEELPEGERACASCHSELNVMKTTERIEIEVIPVKIIKKKYLTRTYVCPRCSEEGEKGAITEAPRKPPVLPGSYVSASLMAYIMAKKYWERTPIYQLEKMLHNSGIDISRATMSRWIIDGANAYLKGVYEHLHQELLKCECLHADETKMQVLKENGRRPQQQSYMWHYASGHLEPRQILLYEYQPGRQAQHPIAFLEGFQGYLHSDGYQVYHKIPGIVSVGCHAHARRKFVETMKGLSPKAKETKNLTMEGFMFFQELSELEQQFKDMTPENRYEARLKASKPKLEALKAWLLNAQGKVTPRSSLGKAIGYSLNQWDHLVAYLEDGRLEMTNNRAERGIKKFVLGRKNWLFSDSKGGAEASEVVYSIVETAIANDLHPYEYLKYLIETLSQHKQTPEKLEEVMPWSDKLPDHVRVVYRQGEITKHQKGQEQS